MSNCWVAALIFKLKHPTSKIKFVRNGWCPNCIIDTHAIVIYNGYRLSYSPYGKKFNFTTKRGTRHWILWFDGRFKHRKLKK